MHKGQLVKVRAHAAGSFLDEGPHVIMRGPYEYVSEHTIQGRKISHLIRCVDLLTPCGDIIEHVACKILVRV